VKHVATECEWQVGEKKKVVPQRSRLFVLNVDADEETRLGKVL
jgi:hypothetical protein